ncbi:MAG: NAD(+)/NADH kinase [Treponema sp.]|jgi:NAD+ kinase|nr:NAD(+)/NADH kinase [Treponema sp.]
MVEIRRALLFVNAHKEAAPLLAEAIKGELASLGIACDFYPFEGLNVPAGDPLPFPSTEERPLLKDRRDADLAFSLGGDGTVLLAARTIAHLGIPIFPINIGTLGFIAVVHPNEWRMTFQDWRRGTAGISRRLMLEVAVEREGKTLIHASSLNDAVISASGIAKIIRLEVHCDSMNLGHYRSDGLIVATPTGSTAYSVAAGGPILDPEMEALIINPICPFTLSNRPMVVPATETVIVEVEAEQRSGVLLTLDGQVTEKLEVGDRVLIRKAPYEARIIASGRKGFYNALQTKLNWSPGSPHA